MDDDAGDSDEDGEMEQEVILGSADEDGEVWDVRLLALAFMFVLY